MLKKVVNKLKKKPSSRIIFRYSLIFIVFALITYLLIPIIFNFGPESINTEFEIQKYHISYRLKMLFISISILAILCAIIKYLLKDIDKWYTLNDEEKYKDRKIIEKIRKKCLNLPYILFVIELVVPLILTTVFLLITKNYNYILIIKIVLFIFSFLLLLDVYSFIFIEDIYTEILKKTYLKNLRIGYRVSVSTRFFMQTLPICITILLLTSIFAYSRAVKEKEDIYFSVYHNILVDKFDNFEGDYNEMCTLLNSISLYEDKHSKFIITPNKELLTIDGPEANSFILDYTTQISEKYNGKIFDSYGVDKQGASIKIQTASGIYYIGILYDISSYETLGFLTYSSVILLLLTCMFLYFFISPLTRKLRNITSNFNKISSNKSRTIELPITSNDEIGDLIKAFNKMQILNNSNISRIKSDQEKLMERERLSSLGELIGRNCSQLKNSYNVYCRSNRRFKRFNY